MLDDAYKCNENRGSKGAKGWFAMLVLQSEYHIRFHGRLLL